MWRVLMRLSFLMLQCVVGCALIWSASALFAYGPGNKPVNGVLAGAWLVGGGICWFFGRRGIRFVTAGVFVIILMYLLSLQPQSNTPWIPEWRLLPDLETANSR